MTVRTTTLGGTDWNNEQLTDDDLNDTIKLTGTMLVKAVNFHSETESTTTANGTYEEAKNATINMNYAYNIPVYITGSVENKLASSDSGWATGYLVGANAGSTLLFKEDNENTYGYTNVNKWLFFEYSSFTNSLFGNAGSYVLSLGGTLNSPSIRGVDLNFFYIDSPVVVAGSSTVNDV